MDTIPGAGKDPQVRVGDADREQTIAALQQYTAEGYLTLEEFSQRSAAAYGARTRVELAAVTEDLAPRAESAPVRRAAASPASGARWWPAVVITVAVLAGLLVVGAAVMAVMMLVMGGMGGMMP